MQEGGTAVRIHPCPVLLLCLAALAKAQQPDVAVVKGTFTINERPSEGRGAAAFCKTIEAGLEQSGVKFNLLTEEHVVKGKLAGHKLAIFPYSAVWHEDEIEQVVRFVEGGGKLMCFYTVPVELRKFLGVGKCGYRRAGYPGEFSVMQFADDRPPGFPAQVRQNSPNTRVIEEVTEDGRTIAVWHDSKGKNTRVPAVVISPHGLYVSHVFKSGNSSEQHYLVLATLGHFIPGKWAEIVEGMLAEAAPSAGHESLEALVHATRHRQAAHDRAKEALAHAGQAKQLLAENEFTRAFTLAKRVQDTIQLAAAASFESRPYELRGAWMGQPTDDTNWDEIMSELEAANFNAIFPLMLNPASAVYPSEYLMQRTKTDQMKACLEAARRHGIEVHVWKANWQILSRSKADARRQQFIDEGRTVVSVEEAMGKEEISHYKWRTRWLDPSDKRNRELEFDTMMELVEKYHPDGIHFDFMRYPSNRYCYCDRCKVEFEEWAGVKVQKWPDDCWAKGKHLAKFRDWRRHLQTSLVKRIAEGARKIDPNVEISLAARASVTGAPENDAQDWMTWARKGYLDMLCPMDYTSSVEVLRKRLQPQLAVIDGAVPVYAGLGVSPSRSATPVNLSQQIKLARELGADGFLMFSLTSFSRAMLPALKLGATSTPVDAMPHHTQPAKVIFRYPDAMHDRPERTYAVGTRLAVQFTASPTSAGAQGLTVQAFLMPAAGGKARTVTTAPSGEDAVKTGILSLQPGAGIYKIVLRGEVVSKGGKRRPYYLRSQPLTFAEP